MGQHFLDEDRFFLNVHYSSALVLLKMEIQQVLADLDLGGKVIVERDRHY
jgi:hypothetical protein